MRRCEGLEMLMFEKEKYKLDGLKGYGGMQAREMSPCLA